MAQQINEFTNYYPSTQYVFKQAQQAFSEQANENNKVKKSSKIDNAYNTSYYLSEREIALTALCLISNTQNIQLNDTQKKYLFTPLDSIDYIQNKDSAFFSFVFDQIQNTMLNKVPSFIFFNSNAHYATIAIMPNAKENIGFSIGYINSINNPESNFFLAGWKFAETFAKSCGTKAIDLSYSHQYDGCWGLSTALNTAIIAKHFAEEGGSVENLQDKFPKFTNQELKELYTSMGTLMQNTLEGNSLEFDQVFNPELFAGNVDLTMLYNALDGEVVGLESGTQEQINSSDNKDNRIYEKVDDQELIKGAITSLNIENNDVQAMLELYSNIIYVNQGGDLY